MIELRSRRSLGAAGRRWRCLLQLLRSSSRARLVGWPVDRASAAAAEQAEPVGHRSSDAGEAAKQPATQSSSEAATQRSSQARDAAKQQSRRSSLAWAASVSPAGWHSPPLTSRPVGLTLAPSPRALAVSRTIATRPSCRPASATCSTQTRVGGLSESLNWRRLVRVADPAAAAGRTTRGTRHRAP